MIAKLRPRTFISYRRDDSAGHAGRLYDRFAERFGKGNVFRDIDVIGAGADFVAAIQQNIAKTDVFIAVIGPQWLSVQDDEGRARLSQSDDLVRLEIAAAFDRRMQVIPVLIQGAGMPTVDQLSQDIAGLARRNAVTLRDTHFDADVDELIRLIAPGWAGKWIAAVAAVVIALVAGVWWLTAPPSPEQALVRLSAMGVDYTPAAFVEAAGLDEPISADLVELFLRAGIDPNTTDTDGWTAGATAARYGNLTVVELLIRENADSERPFVTACVWGYVPIVDFLLSKHPGKEAVNKGLIYAARGGYQEIVGKLLDYGAELNSVVAKGVASYNSTPLMAAASGKKVDIARLLLARGADPNVRTATGWTALHSATRAHSPVLGTHRETPEEVKTVTQVLLDAGAEIDPAAQYMNESTGWTPLLVALYERQAEVAKLLIDTGANVNVMVQGYPNRDHSSTALMMAVFRRHIEGLKILLGAGVQINAADDEGRTALMYAAIHGSSEAARILIQNGADPDANDAIGQTALSLAEKKGYEKVVRVLKCNGCDSN